MVVRKERSLIIVVTRRESAYIQQWGKGIEGDEVGYVVILIRRDYNMGIVFCHLFQFYNAHYSITFQTSCTPGYANKLSNPEYEV